jgi:iron complex transport system permease protein
MISRLFNGRRWLIWPILAGVLVLAMLSSLSLGQFPMTVQQVLSSIFQHIGIATDEAASLTPEQQAVLWNIRLPRTLTALFVGAGLAMAGAVMQAVFSNPLADPGILGVSSGASFGAVLAISTGLAQAGLYYMPAFACIGAMAAVAVTLALCMHHGKIQVMPLLLSGIVVGMLLAALTSAILMVSSNQQLHQYLFWTVGGLDYRRWEHVWLVAMPVLPAIIVILILARHLNILVLGDMEARALGMPVTRYRIGMLMLASVMTAASVCVSGNIGFVGLVMPHMMRLLVGADHRRLLPASAIAGAIFLILCDTAGRVIVPAMEIRAGIMTAIAGTPYFLYLLHGRNPR